MTAVTRTEVRGQCVKGHVIKGEVFGPALPESWLDSCPLPDCGFEIEWQRRPEHLGPIVVAPRDEFANCTDAARDGILHIRSLPDDDVLSAARAWTGSTWQSPAHAAIKAHMGERTNPDWIMARCAEEAYRRDLIDETEFDYLTR